jgi:hypothetical protein
VALQELLVHQDLRVLEVLQELLVLLVHQDLPVLEVLQELLVHLDPLVHQELLEQLVPQ